MYAKQILVAQAALHMLVQRIILYNATTLQPLKRALWITMLSRKGMTVQYYT